MADELVAQEQELQQEGQTIAQRIPLIAITDADSFKAAADDRAAIKRRLDQIHALMDPIVSSAYTTWRTATQRREMLRAPFADADHAYSRAMGQYEREQDRKRRELAAAAEREREQLEEAERARARQEQERLRKAAEDARVADAVQAEQTGDQERAERLLSAPVEVPVVVPNPVHVPQPPVDSGLPAATGITFRTTWRAEVTELLALVRAVARGDQPITLLSPNMVTLNGLARSLRDSMKVPGVRVISERIAPVRKAGP